MARAMLYSPYVKKLMVISAFQDPARMTSGYLYHGEREDRGLKVLSLPEAEKNYTESNPYVNHPGIDGSVVMNTPVYARYESKVWIGPNDGTQGNYINLTEPNGDVVTLAHLNKIVVKSGAMVNAGQLVGYSGNSGYILDPKTGVKRPMAAHLHIHVARNKQIIDAYAHVFDVKEVQNATEVGDLKKLEVYNLNDQTAIMITAGSYVLESTALEVLSSLKLLYPGAGIQTKTNSGYGRFLVVVGRHKGGLKEAQAIAADIRKASGNNSVEAWAW